MARSDDPRSPTRISRSSNDPDDAWLAALRADDRTEVERDAPSARPKARRSDDRRPPAPQRPLTEDDGARARPARDARVQVPEGRSPIRDEGPDAAVAGAAADGRGDDELDVHPMAASADRGRGRHAASPTDIPAKGWKDIAARTLAEAKADQVPLLAAGVAFFALLAVVPALVAVVSIYGLVADPADVTRQVRDLLGAAPTEVRQLIESQLSTIAAESSGAIGFGLLGGLAAALWSASSGMKNAMGALNAAYDEEEDRGFFALRGVALLFTLGAILFLAATVFVLTVVPELLEGSPLGSGAELALTILRWPVLAVGFAVALAVFYRYGPSRENAEWRWVTPGAGIATVAWLIASGGFSVYVSNFGSYNDTYGSLGGIVVVMLWLFITAYVVILGAELDAEMERQTLRDTTDGHDEPIGQRDAQAADTVGATADQVKAART